MRFELRDLGLVSGETLVLLGQLAGVGLVLLFKPHGQPSDLVARQRRSFGCEGGVELGLERHDARLWRVVVRRPHHDVEQLAQHRERHIGPDLPVLVHSGVGDPPNGRQLLRDALRHLRLERGVTDLGGEVVAVRRPQGQDVVEVADELLDDATAVEARGARIRRQVRLGPGAVVME